MTKHIFPSLLAIALASPAAATPGSVRDFQLPTPTPSAAPSAAPDVQGPVDVEGAAVTPRAIPTPAPTAEPSPTSTPTPLPTQTRAATTPQSLSPQATQGTAPIAAPAARSRPSAATNRAAPAPSPTPQASETAETAPSTGVGSAKGNDLDAGLPTLPTNAGSLEAQSDPAQGALILGFSRTFWLTAIAGLMALLAGAWLAYRRRLRPENADAAEIEPQPDVSPEARPQSAAAEAAPAASTAEAAPQPAPSAAPAPSPASPPRVTPAVSPAAKPADRQAVAASNAVGSLHIKAEALSLSRSLMNATLAYRFELQNTGSTDLKEVSVRTDVVTAHSQIPMSEQVADDSTDLQYMGLIASIPSGAKHEVRGEFRLPVSAIRTIAQGQAKLYVPLLRLRVDGEGIDPIISTLVVGIKPPVKGAKLQPFRLDEMAQTYRNIGMRAV